MTCFQPTASPSLKLQDPRDLQDRNSEGEDHSKVVSEEEVRLAEVVLLAEELLEDVLLTVVDLTSPLVDDVLINLMWICR